MGTPQFPIPTFWPALTHWDGPARLGLRAEARGPAGDPALIGCGRSAGSEPPAGAHKGLLLGGSWSPHFLRATADPWSVPSTAALPTPRVLLIDKAVGPLAD